MKFIGLLEPYIMQIQVLSQIEKFSTLFKICENISCYISDDWLYISSQK